MVPDVLEDNIKGLVDEFVDLSPLASFVMVQGIRYCEFSDCAKGECNALLGI